MEGSGEKRELMAGFSPDVPLERLIAERAAAQHGLVALRDLVELGLTADAVRKRVSSGRWRRVHAGVFATGHAPLTQRARYMAAVLACGPGAALSHRDAAALHGIRPSSRSSIDVTSPKRTGRGRRGIDVHSGAILRPHDVVVVDAIPCTTVARTLLDLAEVSARRQVERACDRAELLELFDLVAIEEQLDRAGGRRGAPLLRSIVEDRFRATVHMRSELEERFLELCRVASLPRPQVNAWIALEPTGYEADFLWPQQRLVAELDGHSVHSTRHAFEHDRRRDQRLTLAGLTVVRLTWRQVVEEPAATSAMMRALLAQRAG